MDVKVEWAPELAGALTARLLEQARKECGPQDILAILDRCIDNVLALYKETRDENLMNIALAVTAVAMELEDGKSPEEIDKELRDMGF